MSNHEAPIFDDLVDQQGGDDAADTTWTRTEYREDDPGLAAADRYNGPHPDPTQSTWDEVGLAQPQPDTDRGDEHPTVEYGGPRLDGAVGDDTPVGQPYEPEVSYHGEDDSEKLDPGETATVEQGPFSDAPLYLMTVQDQAQVVQARIKELETEAFRTDLRLWELRTLGQQESEESQTLSATALAYRFLVQEMVTTYNALHGG